MKNIIISISIIVASMMLIVSAFAAGPWKGKLGDIETTKPIEDAVIVAYWERVYRTPAGDNPSIFKVIEGLTDKDGNFEIPAYTPVNLLPIISYIRGPRFTIFKPGYLSLSGVDFGGFFLEGTKEIPIERNDISGKSFRLAAGVIELTRLRTREEIRANIPSLPSWDEFLEDQKNLIRLINEEENNLGLQKSDPFKKHNIPRGKK